MAQQKTSLVGGTIVSVAITGRDQIVKYFVCSPYLNSLSGARYRSTTTAHIVPKGRMFYKASQSTNFVGRDFFFGIDDFQIDVLWIVAAAIR